MAPEFKSSFGSRALGIFAFGLISLAVPGEPSFQQTDLAGMFRRAFEERFRSNGVPIRKDAATEQIVFAVLVRHFRLDFNFGKWISEAGYVLRMEEGGKLVCEDFISEKVVKFNAFGYGSGERAISEVFAKAINRANLNTCLSRVEYQPKE